MTALRAHAVMRRPMQNTGAMHIPFILITVAPKLFLAIAGRYRQSGRFSRVALLMSYTAFVTYVWAQFDKHAISPDPRAFPDYNHSAMNLRYGRERTKYPHRAMQVKSFKFVAISLLLWAVFDLCVPDACAAEQIQLSGSQKNQVVFTTTQNDQSPVPEDGDGDCFCC